MLRNHKWNFLPIWIKVCVVVYCIIGLLVTLAIILSLLGRKLPISIYGLEASSQFSLRGILVLILLLSKGILGYSLLLGQPNAINLGIVDTSVGILMCLLTGFILPFYANENSIHIVLRVELFILVPLLIAFFNIRTKWMNKLFIN